MKQTYSTWEKTQYQQKKHSNSTTTYNHSGHKAEMNVVVQQASEADITLFIKKAKATKKINT